MMQVLEDLTSAPVIGLRGPSFSVVRETERTIDLFIEEGNWHDSLSSASRSAQRTARGNPATSLSFLGQTLPEAGGAYSRILAPSALRVQALQSWSVELRLRPGSPATSH